MRIIIMSLMAALSGANSLASTALSYSNAEQNRSFQRSMDSTKYQRGVADLKAAGLNPIMAAGGMTGSTPSGSAMPAPENAGLAAMTAKKVNAEVDLIESQADATAANAELTREKTRTIGPVSEVAEFIEGWINNNQQDPKKLGQALAKQFGKDVVKTIPEAAMKMQSSNSAKAKSNVSGFLRQVTNWIYKAYKPAINRGK